LQHLVVIVVVICCHSSSHDVTVGLCHRCALSRVAVYHRASSSSYVTIVYCICAFCHTLRRALLHVIVIVSSRCVLLLSHIAVF